MQMDHIHNEAVLAFLEAHKDRPGVKRFLARQDEITKAMDKAPGADYEDYLDYLGANIGDDAEFTMVELNGLLGPSFLVRLSQEEKREYCYEEFEIRLDELMKPVYTKDEGSFFTVWSSDGRIDVPARFLEPFRRLLDENRVEYEDQLGGRTEPAISSAGFARAPE